jgi:hypothetical protein
MKPIKSSLPVTVIVFLALTITGQAQIDTIVRAFVDQAARQSQRPSQQQQQPRRQQQPKQQSNVQHHAKKPFDGTWVATQSKTNPDSQQTINRNFTLIIKDGKATKTLDAVNVSTPEKPFYPSIYELGRRWTYDSIAYTEQGTSITIQWSPGQLTDWTPKTVPDAVVQGFGSPMAETAVYKVNGDQLTRINDPNGLIYQRAK